MSHAIDEDELVNLAGFDTGVAYCLLARIDGTPDEGDSTRFSN
jgi:hypothetical protein